ncbi:MAG: hypothetical protein Q6370_007085 [Candidatus Sigynarchaeota archaeon]
MNGHLRDKKKSAIDALTDRVFPPIALASVATFGWAIRGQAGFGAIPGCVFAGTLIACTWYFWSTRATRDGSPRPFSSGWTLLALIAGIGIEGMHGWSQYGTWIQGKFWVGQDVFWPMNPAFGYAWLFVAAVPWGATGAVFLAWTRRGDHLTRRSWIIRLASGVVGMLGATSLFFACRPVILPYWGTAPYDDFETWEGCMDTYHQILQAMVFMGLFLGFLAFEVWRKHWQNVKLIGIVALITGFGWLVAKTWMFADEAFPTVSWNWWRCWEASGGFAIGLGHAIAFITCNKPRSDHASQPREMLVPGYHRWQDLLERYVGLHAALIIGLTYAVSSLIKGMFAIYDDEDLAVPYRVIAGIMLVGGLAMPVIASLARQLREGTTADLASDGVTFGRIYPIVLSALFIVGLLVTGPITNPSERAFICFYVVLWAINAVMILASMMLSSLSLSSQSQPGIMP